jgi:hypothetical protein
MFDPHSSSLLYILTYFYSYDIWDLGEFDQKGAQRNKWGTKDELLSAIKTAREHGIISYIDAVLNHKWAAERRCTCFLYVLIFGAIERVPMIRRSSWLLWWMRVTGIRRSGRCIISRHGPSESERMDRKRRCSILILQVHIPWPEWQILRYEMGKTQGWVSTADDMK